MYKFILGLALSALALFPVQPARATDGTSTAPVCVTGGCYHYVCTDVCSWVFVPDNPFNKGDKKTN